MHPRAALFLLTSRVSPLNGLSPVVPLLCLLCLLWLNFYRQLYTARG